MPHKIITSAGFGNTGSSAATNFFEEFDNVKCIGSSEFECTFIHEPDGLYDLAVALKEGHRLKVDLAVKRFLALSKSLQDGGYKNYFNGKFLEYTIEFINSLSPCVWKGGWHRAGELSSLSYKEKLREKTAGLEYKRLAASSSYNLYEADTWRPQYVQYRTQYYKNTSKEQSTRKDSFVKFAKQYLTKLFDECDPENKFEYLCFDQLLPPNAGEEYFTFFDYIKVVVVDRDPRDLYFGNKVFWGNRFFPSETPELFSKWYKQTRLCKKSTTSKNILYINFEDFIFNYDKVESELCTFSGLNKKNHTKKFQFLIPEKSEQNIYLWKKFIFNDKAFQNKIADDISLIEKELKNHCYKNYPYPTEIPVKSQEFIIENAITQADLLITKKHFTFTDYSHFIINSIKNIFCNLKLIHAIQWFNKVYFINRLENKSKYIMKFLFKIIAYLILAPAEIIFKFTVFIIELFLI